LNILGVFKTQEEVNNSPKQHPRVQPGDFRYQDADGNGTITSADRTIVGNPWPDFTWGMGNQFSYKSLRLNISHHRFAGK
jgi:hypothetical protein